MTEHDELSYYGEVEAYFVERRGSPLFITPAEWHLVSKWERAGIPLHVVKEGIDRVFDRPQAAVKPRKLGYCRQTVEAAFRRFREVSLGGGGGLDPEEDQFDATRHLARLAAELETSAPELAGRVAVLRDAGDDLVATEDALTAIDAELVDNAETRLDDAAREALVAEAQASLASYQDRMPDDVYQSAFKSAYRRRLRETLGLPRLSLYDR